MTQMYIVDAIGMHSYNICVSTLYPMRLCAPRSSPDGRWGSSWQLVSPVRRQGAYCVVSVHQQFHFRTTHRVSMCRRGVTELIHTERCMRRDQPATQPPAKHFRSIFSHLIHMCVFYIYIVDEFHALVILFILLLLL